MIKIVYGVCEFCGRYLTELIYDNVTKRNAAENITICNACFKAGKAIPKSDEELALVSCPAGRWPPSTPYWVRRRKCSNDNEMHGDDTHN